jgi:hypothetical protein
MEDLLGSLVGKTRFSWLRFMSVTSMTMGQAAHLAPSAFTTRSQLFG